MMIGVGFPRNRLLLVSNEQGSIVCDGTLVWVLDRQKKTFFAALTWVFAIEYRDWHQVCVVGF